MAAGKKRLDVISQIIQPKSDEAISQNKPPRNGKLKRDELLIARYYYYTVINKKSVNDVLEALENEFHLSSKYITELIEGNIYGVKELRNKIPKIKWFNDRWPWLKW